MPPFNEKFRKKLVSIIKKKERKEILDKLQEIKKQNGANKAHTKSNYHYKSNEKKDNKGENIINENKIIINNGKNEKEEKNKVTLSLDDNDEQCFKYNGLRYSLAANKGTTGNCFWRILFSYLNTDSINEQLKKCNVDGVKGLLLDAINLNKESHGKDDEGKLVSIEELNSIIKFLNKKFKETEIKYEIHYQAIEISYGNSDEIVLSKKVEYGNDGLKLALLSDNGSSSNDSSQGAHWVEAEGSNKKNIENSNRNTKNWDDIEYKKENDDKKNEKAIEVEGKKGENEKKSNKKMKNKIIKKRIPINCEPNKIMINNKKKDDDENCLKKLVNNLLDKLNKVENADFGKGLYVQPSTYNWCVLVCAINILIINDISEKEIIKRLKNIIRLHFWSMKRNYCNLKKIEGNGKEFNAFTTFKNAGISVSLNDEIGSFDSIKKKIKRENEPKLMALIEVSGDKGRKHECLGHVLK